MIENPMRQIAQFKKIKHEPSILILLPRSGGAGLNFTDVGLNIMATTEWTHEKDRQAKGRILRGTGVKKIVNLRTKIPQTKHKVQTVKKKKRLSDLFLKPKVTIRDLLKAAEAMMRSEEQHAIATAPNNLYKSIHCKVR